MNTVKFGIIGVGNMGSSHLRSFLEKRIQNGVVTAIADIDPTRLEAAGKTLADFKAKDATLPDIVMYEDASEMIRSADIDAVIVSVPHYDHPRYVIEAMQSGKHVMCEKPAGVYTLQVRDMIAEADRHPELKFGMMFNQRTNCVYRKMKEILASGSLGAIKRTSWIITNWYRPAAYYNSGAWRATWSGEGGGVLLNQCPHNLDLWQWICGMPKKVLTKMHFGKWHDIEVEDDVTTYVEYENGATGTFITTTGDAPGTNRFEVVCDGGTLICDGNTIVLKKLEMPESEFTLVNTAPFGSPKVTTSTLETDGRSDQHVGVLNAFVGAITEGTPLVADGREGIHGLTLSNAMHLSAWLGREVELPFDEGEFKELLFERVKTSRRKENVTAVLADTEGSYNA